MAVASGLEIPNRFATMLLNWPNPVGNSWGVRSRFTAASPSSNSAAIQLTVNYLDVAYRKFSWIEWAGS